MKITSVDGVEMEFCCERMDHHISSGTTFSLKHRSTSALWVKCSPSSAAYMSIDYCPFCGTRVNITHDPFDHVLFSTTEL